MLHTLIVLVLVGTSLSVTFILLYIYCTFRILNTGTKTTAIVPIITIVHVITEK